MQAKLSKARRMLSAAIVAIGFATSPTDSGAALFGFDSFFNNSGVADTVDEKALVATGDPSSLVPEPASLLLLGTGLAGIAAASRRRRKQQRDDA